MYVGKVAEGGNGCFTTESRPHTDWLGAGWWRDLDICLDGREEAEPAALDLRREMVAQPGRRREGAPALRGQTAGGSDRRSGRAARV